ncbi:Stk1 family PASTA domain-containing Ser/Thr kinase [Microbacterium dextranolyticum]|uniref:non-specific serine/threonine protein kinase n=1 Tax=Microbacterium dextranolyticum TaxID=36806 RepID=A0A9W6HPD3_9MICO|nr:Stk1 family PASTA domain-containing Ser/Thr kinase [Microbacterium dextranolyticum]MBM7462632.1 serine/threonine-protein kinase [Microbacterium dextranolyticum]GLJ96265.1 serine/threonine protein kinase [Microbacterium dextranolyticum]
MSTSQQTDPLIGRLVDGRYRVRARIARGGMATVYVATDLRLERRVALKVMHSHLSDDTVFQGRFIQEARAAARLADPHVVNVFDQGQDGEMAYLVMEYLPGITLRDLLREQRRLSIPQTITIMDAVLSGLAAAHRAGIVHRDVKPENVLLAEDGRIKIGDFGLARATSANTATGQMLLGTIAYLAPELVTRGTADARSDIYALGIMLYEMLVGEQPYKGEQPMQIAYQHATDSVPRPSAKNPGVPESLDELVMWATERDPEERPADARAMLDRLREVEKELGVFPHVVRAPAPGIVAVDDGIDSGEVTKVMPGTFTAPIVTEATDNATLLRRRARARTRRGWWLIVLVLVLTGAAGGTGWWFGSGPGSLVAVPDVSGMSLDEAAGVLAGASLVASPGEDNSREVPTGQTIRTDPAIGERVAKDSPVTVIVSLGPATHEIRTLSGVDITQATRLLGDAYITPSGDPVRYFEDAASGTVTRAMITPPGGGDAVDCTEGCSALEGATVAFEVSAGPVPDVSGRSLDSARTALSAVDLNATTTEEYDDDIASGRVIRIAPTSDGARLQPGQTVTLVVSKGPAPIKVPDVTGQTVAAAMDALRKAGFEPGTALPEIVWSIFTVSSTSPAAGTMQLPGTKITVRSTG